MEERYKRRRFMASGTRNYLKQQLDKFNQEFSRDKPLDFNEFEHIIGLIEDEPFKYPEVIQFLRENMSPADESKPVSQIIWIILPFSNPYPKVKLIYVFRWYVLYSQT